MSGLRVIIYQTKGVGIMKKLTTIVIICSILLLPGVASATAYNNSIPSGSTLLYWSVVKSGDHTSATFVFSGNLNVNLPISVPFDSSWHVVDDTRPIILAHQKGDDNYLGGTNGVFGSNIKFADNVLAAMKVQNFNPSTVGGADIPPASTSLTGAEKTWLSQPGVGYASDLTSIQSSTSQPQSQTQVQPQPAQVQSSNKQSVSSTGSSSAPAPAQQTQTQVKSNPVKSSPAVGQTVKSPSGSMTQDMVSADKKLAAQNPPIFIPSDIPVPKKAVKKPATLTAKLLEKWPLLAGVGVAVLILLAAVMRILYLRKKQKEA
jgi:hypothetical protein